MEEELLLLSLLLLERLSAEREISTLAQPCSCWERSAWIGTFSILLLLPRCSPRLPLAASPLAPGATLWALGAAPAPRRAWAWQAGSPGRGSA